MTGVQTCALPIYGFTYQGEKAAAVHGTESISAILRLPVLHIVSQNAYRSGGAAAVRVIVSDAGNNVVEGESRLRIELAAPGGTPKTLYSGALNGRGTVEAQFAFPAGLTGSLSLRYVVETPIGETEFTQTVRLEEKAAILLTTEKPLYQPGQTIHVRALALERGDHAAVA